MEFLYENLLNLTWQHVVMWIIGGVLIYLAIKKDMEPTLLLPLGFGAIMVNLPFSGAVTQFIDGATEHGALSILFNAGIANELFPLILFIGIGAMIDFRPVLSNPKLMIFGAAAQFGIFITLCLASMFFDINDAASIAIIGAAKTYTAIVLIAPLIVLAIPLLDTTLAIFRRMIKTKSLKGIFQADKEHLHHQLLGMNFSQKTTVLIIYGINLLFAAASIFYTIKDPVKGRIIYILIFILVVWFVFHTSIISDKSETLRKNIKKKENRR